MNEGQRRLNAVDAMCGEGIWEMVLKRSINNRLSHIRLEPGKKNAYPGRDKWIFQLD
jgi:hypothetical protein